MIIEQIKSSPLYIKADDAYHGLAPRDQLSLSVLAVFALFVVIIFGLIQPANNYMSNAQKQYRSSLEKLSWMQANKEAVSSISQQRSTRDPEQSLLGIANSSSKGFQITFKRYEPVGDNGLSLWMEQVSFNRVILWLERLDKRYGISVQEISVGRQLEEGLVNVRLVLQG